MYYVGIDTSCYTTSIAVLNESGELLLDSRKLLTVKDGERGLRQSEGLFQHIVNLEEMIPKLDFVKEKIKSVTASKKPRNEEGSYMPVFRGGSLAGSFLVAGSSGVFLETSHQEGHLYSALWSLRTDLEISELKRFLFFHISGGTTELLLAEQVKDYRFTLKRIGGTSDLNGGQFIDRVGVASGLSFPCGSQMDQILQEKKIRGVDQAKDKVDDTKVEKIHLKTSVKNREISFSGPETQAFRLLTKGEDREQIYQAVFETIEKALGKVILSGSAEFGIDHVIVSGGVAANSFIREGLEKKLNKEKIKVYFPNIKYASDNAVGNAYFGYLNQAL